MPLAVRTPNGDVGLLTSFDNPPWEARTGDVDYANALVVAVLAGP